VCCALFRFAFQEPDLLCNYLGSVVLHGVLFPSAGLELPFDISQMTFGQILHTDLGEATPRDNRVPVGFRVLLVDFVAPGTYGCQAKLCYGRAVRQKACLRVFPETESLLRILEYRESLLLRKGNE
jgi:hypothetical protein